jgi:hypothetical protein
MKRRWLAARALFAGAVIFAVGLAVRAWTRPVWMAEFNETWSVASGRRSPCCGYLGLMLSGFCAGPAVVLPAVDQAIPVRVAAVKALGRKAGGGAGRMATTLRCWCG